MPSPGEGADTTIWLATTRPCPEPKRLWRHRRRRPDHYLPGNHDDPDALRRAWRYCLSAAGR